MQSDSNGAFRASSMWRSLSRERNRAKLKAKEETDGGNTYRQIRPPTPLGHSGASLATSAVSSQRKLNWKGKRKQKNRGGKEGKDSSGSDSALAVIWEGASGDAAQTVDAGSRSSTGSSFHWPTSSDSDVYDKGEEEVHDGDEDENGPGYSSRAKLVISKPVNRTYMNQKKHFSDSDSDGDSDEDRVGDEGSSDEYSASASGIGIYATHARGRGASAAGAAGGGTYCK